MKLLLHRLSDSAKRQPLWVAALVLVMLAALSSSAFAQRAPNTVDGNLWLNSSTEIRKAFLVGAANMLAMEEAYAKKHGTAPPTAGAMTRKATDGLTLDEVSNRITRWYEANPSRSNMPVMGVIWLDMVKPSDARK